MPHSGAQKGGNTSVTFQLGGAFSAAVGLEYNKIELPGPGGDFDATLGSVRIGYSFNPSVYLQSLVQYNSQTRVFSGNFRFGWIDTAGTGLFVVYNERQSDRLSPAFDGLLERTFSIKFSRQVDVAQLGRDWLGS